MANCKQIQAWVKQQYGFAPETCWIAHVKELMGLSVRSVPNRKGKVRIKPCPEDKVEQTNQGGYKVFWRDQELTKSLVGSTGEMRNFELSMCDVCKERVLHFENSIHNQVIRRGDLAGWKKTT